MRWKFKPWIIYFLYKIDKLDAVSLKRIKFKDLIYISKVLNDHQEYENLMMKIVELQKKNLKAKIKKRRIKVGFMCESSTAWGFDDVFEKLKYDGHFEPYAVVPLLADNEFKKHEKKDTKLHSILYFKKKKIKYYVIKEKKDAQWGDKLPDILFTQRPYPKQYLQENFWKENMPCSCMQMFVPYSFWIGKVDYSFSASDYVKIYSGVFTPSKFHKKFYEERAHMDKRRVFYSGYPKLDLYYKDDKKNIDISRIWKNGTKKVRIIYAPEYIDPMPVFSTFNLNYKLLLDIAKETKERVSWVIRVHPMLPLSAVENGIFKNMDDWNSYLKEWEEFADATVSIEGSYADIFKTSDAMIMDSISFLPSYQYVHKPLLFLTRKTQEMNDLGNQLKEVVYNADAKDAESIRSFIDDVVINGNDEKKEIREAFFQKNLDYYAENGQFASDFIVSTVKDMVGL